MEHKCLPRPLHVRPFELAHSLYCSPLPPRKCVFFFIWSQLMFNTSFDSSRLIRNAFYTTRWVSKYFISIY